MSDYKLQISISEEDLKVLYKAGGRIVIREHSSDNANHNLNWISFLPFENNVIDWNGDYGLYASIAEPDSQGQIEPMSFIAAKPQYIYEFSNGIFHNPEFGPGLGVSTYEVNNRMTEYKGLTFGLAKDAIVNGISIEKRPFSAQYVPFGMFLSVEASEKIDIFWRFDTDKDTSKETSKEIDNLIRQLESQVLTVEFLKEDHEHKAQYDGKQGCFVLVG